MEARRTVEPMVSVLDHVSVDGQPGIAVGFYAREERIVVVRLDAAGIVEVPESQVVLLAQRKEVGWPKSMCGQAGRPRGDDTSPGTSVAY
jgi:hypothetical protein